MNATESTRDLAALGREVTELDSYRPSERVNGLFRRLVERVRAGDGPVGLGPAERREVRRACATAEQRLEEKWGRRVATADDPAAALERFPYLANYRRLARAEHEAAVDVRERVPERAAFVGGGPLPLSALLFARDHGWGVTVVDREPGAVETARRVAARLGVDVTVRRAEGAAVDYDDYDLVHVAALVGSADDAAVYERVAETAGEGTTLAARTARGRRRVLYPPLPERVHEAFAHRRTVRPGGEVINSTVLFAV